MIGDLAKLIQIPVRVSAMPNSTDYVVRHIPDGVLGQVYVLLARSGAGLGDGDVVAGPAVVEVRGRCSRGSVERRRGRRW